VVVGQAFSTGIIDAAIVFAVIVVDTLVAHVVSSTSLTFSMKLAREVINALNTLQARKVASSFGTVVVFHALNAIESDGSTTVRLGLVTAAVIML
jgi:hypothetical protein